MPGSFIPSPPLFACSFEKGLWRRRRRRRTSGGLLPPTQCIHTGRSFPPFLSLLVVPSLAAKEGCLGGKEKAEGKVPPPSSLLSNEEPTTNTVCTTSCSLSPVVFPALSALFASSSFPGQGGKKNNGGTLTRERRRKKKEEPFFGKKKVIGSPPILSFQVCGEVSCERYLPSSPPCGHIREEDCNKKRLSVFGKEGVEGFLYTNLQQNHG